MVDCAIFATPDGCHCLQTREREKEREREERATGVDGLGVLSRVSIFENARHRPLSQFMSVRNERVINPV